MSKNIRWVLVQFWDKWPKRPQRNEKQVHITVTVSVLAGFFLRKMFGTRYGPDFSDSKDPMIISLILGTRIGSRKHLKKNLVLGLWVRRCLRGHPFRCCCDAFRGVLERGGVATTPQWQADNKNNLMQPEQDEEQTLRVSTAWLQVSQELAPTI